MTRGPQERQHVLTSKRYRKPEKVQQRLGPTGAQRQPRPAGRYAWSVERERGAEPIAQMMTSSRHTDHEDSRRVGSRAGREADVWVAKHLHESLPNATYVGFTGTPIDARDLIMGSVIDSCSTDPGRRIFLWQAQVIRSHR